MFGVAGVEGLGSTGVGCAAVLAVRQEHFVGLEAIQAERLKPESLNPMNNLNLC